MLLPPRARLFLWVLTPLLLCSACGSSRPLPPVTRLEVEKLHIPMALLECQPDPEIPDALLGDRDLADYVVSLWAAGDDCRGKLGAARDLTQ